MNNNGQEFPVGDDGFDAEATLTNMLGLYTFQFEKHIKQVSDAKHLRRLLVAMIAKPTAGTAIELETEVVESLRLAEAAKNEKQGAIEEYEASLRNLSTGQLKRLANAIVQYPFSHKLFIKDDDNQGLLDTFVIGQKLMEAKTLYFQMSLMQYQIEEHQKQQLTDAVLGQTTVEDGVKTNE